jgi:hypothetical protein
VACRQLGEISNGDVNHADGGDGNLVGQGTSYAIDKPNHPGSCTPFAPDGGLRAPSLYWAVPLRYWDLPQDLDMR